MPALPCRQRKLPAPLSPTRPALRFREIAFSCEPLVCSVCSLYRSVGPVSVTFEPHRYFSGDIAPVARTSTRSRALARDNLLGRDLILKPNARFGRSQL